MYTCVRVRVCEYLCRIVQSRNTEKKCIVQDLQKDKSSDEAELCLGFQNVF